MEDVGGVCCFEVVICELVDDGKKQAVWQNWPSLE